MHTLEATLGAATRGEPSESRLVAMGKSLEEAIFRVNEVTARVAAVNHHLIGTGPQGRTEAPSHDRLTPSGVVNYLEMVVQNLHDALGELEQTQSMLATAGVVA